MSSNDKVSLREKIASMLMFGFRGTQASEYGVSEIINDIKKYNLGGVILFKYNIISPEQLKSLTRLLSQADSRLLIAVDQEGGKVQRLNSKNGFKDFDTAKKVAENYSAEEAYRIYLEMAEVLKDYGINFNFAPCVDIDTQPSCSVIGGLERSFSHSPEKIIQYSKKFMDAHKKYNIITTLKHFPGHGYARGDTHQGLVDMTNSANPDVELQPYQELLKGSSHTAVMTAHIVNRNLDEEGFPATLSKKIITTILRGKLGFQGVVVTDALEMGAIREHYKLEDVIYNSINAGNDILVLTRNAAASLDSDNNDDWNTTPKKVIDIIEEAVLKDIIPESRIDESYLRVARLKNNAENNCLWQNYFDNGNTVTDLHEV